MTPPPTSAPAHNVLQGILAFRNEEFWSPAESEKPTFLCQIDVVPLATRCVPLYNGGESAVY